IDLLLEAVALDPSLRAVVVSDGPDQERLEALIRERRLDGRGELRGRVSADGLGDPDARRPAGFHAPRDEDFGMGPYASFLAEKPVITTTDAGGPLDVVHDRATGLVVAPAPAEIATAAVWLREHPDAAASLGRAGRALAVEVTWDRAIARLLS